jgi:transposase
MGKPYSIDLRERVQAKVERGQSRHAAARRYDVSASLAHKLVRAIQPFRDKGCLLELPCS